MLEFYAKRKDVSTLTLKEENMFIFYRNILLLITGWLLISFFATAFVQAESYKFAVICDTRSDSPLKTVNTQTT